MAKKIEIAGELVSTATGNKVADVANIKDKTQGDKSQAQINAEHETALADRYTKAETYNKTELNNMVTTPNQQYVSVIATVQTTSVTDVLPSTGAANTIYRVGNWDDSQFDDSVYSEYAWNGSQYVHLSTKTNIGEVFDISAYHATSGTLAIYDNLAAALDSENGGGVPFSLRKGGMSIKFIHTSDNKYVQYRLMQDDWSIDTGDWAIAEEDVYIENPEWARVFTDKKDRILFGIKADGSIEWSVGIPTPVKEYIEEVIGDLSLDEYEDIVAFLGNLVGGDKTLQQLLETKVDKVEGKSLIDEGYASSQSANENPEYIQVVTDKKDRVLEGITAKGIKQINTPLEVQSAEVSGTNNEEYRYVVLSKSGKILYGILVNGIFYTPLLKSDSGKFTDIEVGENAIFKNAVVFENGIPSQIEESITEIEENCNIAINAALQEEQTSINEDFYQLSAQTNNIINVVGTQDFIGKVMTVISPYRYSCWPFIGVVANKLVCLYSECEKHEAVTGAVKVSLSDNGIIWTPKRLLIDDPDKRDNVTGKGNDYNGNLLFWNRVGFTDASTKIDLYRTVDGISVEKISTLNFEEVVQPVDIIQVPTVGLLSFFHVYVSGTTRSWGVLKSNDNGLTWTKQIIESNVSHAECPVEIYGVYVGNGKILAIGRYDYGQSSNPKLWQIQSSDYGETWTKVATNISGSGNTSGVLFDENTQKISLFCYMRGTGQLKYWEVDLNTIWDNPTNWPSSTTIAIGGRGQDAGNVNVTWFRGNKVAAYYSGTSQNTGIYLITIN